jgi:hypothetical protein
MNLLIRIEAPHFVAGVELEDNKVVRGAPILSYMRGWSRIRVVSYCHSKRWHVHAQEIEHEDKNRVRLRKRLP